MALQAIIRWLIPREDHFYDYLERQARAAREGAKALARFSEGDSAEQVREAVQKWEHEGDRIVHELEEALARTFVTPIDREDLQKMSAELDNVLDLINGSIRACTMFGVTNFTPPMTELSKKIVECTEKVCAAVEKLRKHAYADIVALAREIRALEKEGDTIYREAVRALFVGSPKDESGHRLPVDDARVLVSEMAILEDLENALDECDALADTLAYLAVKHG